MVDLRPDVSSYEAKDTAPNPLDMVQKLGGIRQQQNAIQLGDISIERAKMEKAGLALNSMRQAIQGIGPNGTKEQYLAVGANLVKQGVVPADQFNSYKERVLSTNPKQFYIQTMSELLNHGEAINWALGGHGSVDNGQTVTPTLQSNNPNFVAAHGGTVAPAGLPVQKQLPVTTEVQTPQGSQLLGPQNPQGPQGPLPVAPGVIPGQAAPVAPAAKAKLPTADQNRQAAAADPATFEQRFGYKPTGPMTSQPPMFEEGKKQLAEDQALASTKLTAIKPAEEALKMMKDLRSGPGTPTWNTAVAFLKANNIVPTQANDPTAIYQEVNKYLNRYVQGSGTRSDADLASREVSSPNVGTQINPALVKLTRNAIALDKVEASRANAFEGSDYSKYGQHRASYPASIDERAFDIGHMEPKERKDLLDEMKKKKNTPEGKKFWRSLGIADKQGLINPP